MGKDILQTIQDAKNNNNLISLYRDDLQVTDYTGFITNIGKDLIVLQRENDFSLDGYVAIKLEDVTYTEIIDDNKFIRKVVSGEKLLQKLTPPKLTTADSFQSLFSGILATFGGWLTVEVMSPDGQGFFLGIITRMDSNYMYMKQVDAMGVWNKEETTIPLQDIVTITFGGRYVEIYRKYVK